MHLYLHFLFTVASKCLDSLLARMRVSIQLPAAPGAKFTSESLNFSFYIKSPVHCIMKLSVVPFLHLPLHISRNQTAIAGEYGLFVLANSLWS